MAYAASVDGPFLVSGSISFSQLQSIFGGSAQNVSLSAYVRDTNTASTAPRVPDATENANIPSSTSNLSLSKYRNSIRQYFITQSGTDLNANFVTGPNWNSNLGKNVPKTIFVTGTCGSNSTSSYAASFDGTTYNLKIEVTGNILGAGGAINSSVGGPALYVKSSGGTVTVIPKAPIYGGGGGGARGFDGATGTPGTCFYYTYYNTGNGCGFCPGCGSCTQTGCFGNGGCNCSKKGCSSTFYYSSCRCTVYYAVPGAPGGTGGNGGRGRGYDYQSPNSLAGSGGTAGTGGGCPSYGGSGDAGQTGESGGDWGSPGGTTYRYNQSRAGGSNGKGVSGEQYTIDNGTLGGNAANILGGY